MDQLFLSVNSLYFQVNSKLGSLIYSYEANLRVLGKFKMKQNVLTFGQANTISSTLVVSED